MTTVPSRRAPAFSRSSRSAPSSMYSSRFEASAAARDVAERPQPNAGTAMAPSSARLNARRLRLMEGLFMIRNAGKNRLERRPALSSHSAGLDDRALLGVEVNENRFADLRAQRGVAPREEHA